MLEEGYLPMLRLFHLIAIPWAEQFSVAEHTVVETLRIEG